VEKTIVYWFSQRYDIDGPTLNVLSSTNGAVEVSFYASLSATLYAGFETIVVGLAIGFALEQDPGTTLVHARLSTPPLEGRIRRLIEGPDYVPGVLQYDQTAHTYTNVPILGYDNETAVVSVNLPGPGIFVFVNIQKTITVPYNVAPHLYAWANQTLKFGDDCSVTFRSRWGATLTLTKSTSSPHSNNSTQNDPRGTSLNVFLELTLGGSAASHGPHAHESVIQYHYTDQQLADAKISAGDEKNLRLFFYNEDTQTWEQPQEGFSIDTDTKTLTQTTPHFAEWAVYTTNPDLNGAMAAQASLFMIGVVSMLALTLLALQS